MSSGRPHDIILYGGSGSPLRLRPWSQQDYPGITKRSGESVHPWNIHTSPDAFCFLVEAHGIPIGQCRLQNPQAVARPAASFKDADVWRTSVLIEDPAYWGRGFGTHCIKMLLELAFCSEHAAVVYWICQENCSLAVNAGKNHRASAMGDLMPAKQSRGDLISEQGCLTRQQYIAGRRVPVPLEEQQMLSLHELQPSQLYISAGKLRLVQEWFDPDSREGFDPIPVKLLGGRTVMMDGHTRAVAAHLAGWNHVPVYWDQDDLDLAAYAMYVRWCREEGITDPRVLAQRIVPHKEFEERWRRRCMEGR